MRWFGMPKKMLLEVCSELYANSLTLTVYLSFGYSQNPALSYAISLLPPRTCLTQRKVHRAKITVSC